MIRRAIYAVGTLAAAASGQPWNYTLSVVTTREVAAGAAETGAAFGIPALSRTETTLTFTLAPADDGAYRITFVTARQQTITGETVIPDVEKVATLLPGRWLELAPRTMAEGGVRRSPEFVKDSEELSYNFLAIMLFPPGGPAAALWGGDVVAAVARSYGVGVVSFETAKAVPLPPFEGEAAPGLQYQVTFEQKLSQNTGVSTMTGAASLEGVGESVVGEDGVASCARLDLAGDMERSFVIFGGQQNLMDHVAVSLRLCREGSVFPPAWNTDGGGVE